MLCILSFSLNNVFCSLIHRELSYSFISSVVFHHSYTIGYLASVFLINGHLGCFQAFATTSNTVMKTLPTQGDDYARRSRVWLYQLLKYGNIFSVW